ncbi:MAG: hypothetical protein KC910_31895 [Candidatus Eremiobacteraeota bacterium]|nr:hypothetical protein [Candidatus Eremiobacteraeota bacterium]
MSTSSSKNFAARVRTSSLLALFLYFLTAISAAEDLKISVAGPAKAIRDQTTSLVVRLAGGSPPLRWEWSAEGYRESGDAAEFKMAGKGTAGQLEFHLKIWDQDDYQVEPYETSFPLEVIAEPPKPMRVVLKTHYTRTDDEALTLKPEITGGTGVLRYQWLVDDRTVSEPSLEIPAGPAGDSLVVLRVYDQGLYQDQPEELKIKIHTLARLQGRIEGPDQVIVNDPLEFRAVVEGGTKPYTYLWQWPTGSRDDDDVLTGRVGPDTGERWIRVIVTDSSKPPQELRLEKTYRAEAR